MPTYLAAAFNELIVPGRTLEKQRKFISPDSIPPGCFCTTSNTHCALVLLAVARTHNNSLCNMPQLCFGLKPCELQGTLSFKCGHAAWTSSATDALTRLARLFDGTSGTQLSEHVLHSVMQTCTNEQMPFAQAASVSNLLQHLQR